MPAESNRIHTFLALKQPGVPDRIVVWDTQEISLGRSPENDLVIDHVEISRRHAQFLCTDKNYVIQNLSGSNGTLVNDAPVTTQALQSRDVIRLAELEITFYQSARDPVALGRNLEYASQLKEFAGPTIEAGDGDATILGLADPIGDSEEAFEVQPARDFAYELHDIDGGEAAKSGHRDLDLELEGFGLDDLGLPADEPTPERAPEPKGTPEFLELEDVAESAGRLSLHLEIEGLEGELRRTLHAFAGKVIELPPLKIRIVADDLG